MDTFKTKQGYMMDVELRARLVKLVRQRPSLSVVAMAKYLGVNRRTISDYLTDEVRAEIIGPYLAPSMEEVDRAMMEQACQGNVAAARLVYMRMAQKGQAGPLPTLDELETELRNLKQLEEKRDGARADDADAVGADAIG
jgi:predicted transcriptional regulator